MSVHRRVLREVQSKTVTERLALGYGVVPEP